MSARATVGQTRAEADKQAGGDEDHGTGLDRRRRRCEEKPRDRRCHDQSKQPTVTLFGTPFITWRGVPLVPSDKIKIEGSNGSEATKIVLVRTGQKKQGVVGLFQPGVPGEVAPSLSVQFMGINRKAIASYLISLYFSVAVLTDDALAVLEGVEWDAIPTIRMATPEQTGEALSPPEGGPVLAAGAFIPDAAVIERLANAFFQGLSSGAPISSPAGPASASTPWSAPAPAGVIPAQPPFVQPEVPTNGVPSSVPYRSYGASAGSASPSAFVQSRAVAPVVSQTAIAAPRVDPRQAVERRVPLRDDTNPDFSLPTGARSNLRLWRFRRFLRRSISARR